MCRGFTCVVSAFVGVFRIISCANNFLDAVKLYLSLQQSFFIKIVTIFQKQCYFSGYFEFLENLRKQPTFCLLVRRYLIRKIF